MIHIHHLAELFVRLDAGHEHPGDRVHAANDTGEEKDVNPSARRDPTTEPLERAMRFYEKHGYRRSGRVTDFFGMTLHEWVKSL